MKKIKLLYINNNIKIDSGVSSVIMNYYRRMDKRTFDIDFLLMDRCENSYDEEIKNNGSNIYYLNNSFSFNNIRKIQNEVEKLFEINKYDIVELHAPNLSFIFLKAAKKYNIPIRIVHSHSTKHSTNAIKNIASIVLNINLKKYANRFFGCSEKSGEYWYGDKICKSKNYKTILNGTDIEKFEFDYETRKELRNQYSLDDKIVVGFVGRLSKDKNLDFFINVMKKVILKDNRFVLMIIGDGTEKEKLQKKCDKIKENVIFLGRCNDVNKKLSCMDLLVLTSKREGLPMSIVEAQLVGVPCYISDTITREVDIGNTTFLKLKNKLWVNSILNYKKEIKKIDREKFNIDLCTKELENIYINEIEGMK